MNNNIDDEEYFKNWAEQYYDSARNINEKIKIKKEQRKNIYDNNKIAIIDNDISILTESYYDCMETARILLTKANRERCKKIRKNKNG